jgi:hypothetical protein
MQKIPTFIISATNIRIVQGKLGINKKKKAYSTITSHLTGG